MKFAIAAAMLIFCVAGSEAAWRFQPGRKLSAVEEASNAVNGVIDSPLQTTIAGAGAAIDGALQQVEGAVSGATGGLPELPGVPELPSGRKLRVVEEVTNVANDVIDSPLQTTIDGAGKTIDGALQQVTGAAGEGLPSLPELPELPSGRKLRVVEEVTDVANDVINNPLQTTIDGAGKTIDGALQQVTGAVGGATGGLPIGRKLSTAGKGEEAMTVA